MRILTFLVDHNKDIIEKRKFHKSLPNAISEKSSELDCELLSCVILSGRPYHIDPEISHGIADLLTSLGCAVITEDAVSPIGKAFLQRPIRVLDPVFFHTRLYHAAAFVGRLPDITCDDGTNNSNPSTKEIEDVLLEKNNDSSQLLKMILKNSRNIHFVQLVYC
jgi:predicted nucleotide-binding protein (sugar kinase/HSP70/actin superfamily)